MRVKFVAGAAIGVGVLAIAGILLFGPRSPMEDYRPAAVNTPTLVAGPAVPTTFPYDRVALLRSQRMSDDVLGQDTFDTSGRPNDIVRDSTRHVFDVQGERIYVAVDEASEPCILYTAGPDYAGGVYGCGPKEGTKVQDGVLVSVGTDPHLSVILTADGFGRPAKATADYHEVEPGVWLSISPDRG